MAADLAALQQSMTSQKELQEQLAKSEARNKALMETVARQEQALAQSASQVRQHAMNGFSFSIFHASDAGTLCMQDSVA